MKVSPRLTAVAVLALGLTMHAAVSRAEVFDWNNVTYSSTTATPTNKTTLTNTAVTSNTFSVQFGLNNGATFSTATTSPNSASNSQDTTYYTSGGLATGQKSLQIVVDFADNTQNMLVTIFFAKPVANVSFSLFDVDSGTAGGGGYQDRLSAIRGLGTNGTTVVNPISLTNIGATSTNTIDSVNQATAVAQSSAAQASNLGNITATFGATPITQFSFVYGDVFAGGTHSAVQLIGLSNINFTTVPEPGTLASVGLGLAGVAGVALRRRRR